jgi:tetratricopeptide (TPR) repeat protein
MRRYSLEIALGLLLAVLTAAVFSHNGLGGLPACDFINFDDPVYVQENDHVLGGLTRDNLIWAFTTTSASNWHPLTWLSLQADAQVNPAGFLAHGCHLTNLGWHILNTLLLFAVLRRMSRAVWASALVAVLFAVHPLHVESVAWISERKDVLSTFFWMLTLWAYAAYVARPAWWRYSLMLLAFALGLLAKPMLVTLPFVLLLLDYWPLGRMKSEIRNPNPAGLGFRISNFGFRLLEKLPLFALSIASCVVTWYVQQKGGAVQSLTRVSLGSRVANGVVAYASYLVQTIWPADLTAFYPHPGDALPWWRVAGAALLLTAITILALRQIRRRPYLAVGWFWYLGTAVPVIGLVQVGAQAMADRYTYIPLIGVFIMVAWASADLTAHRPAWRVAVASLMIVLVVGCLNCTWRQVSYWHDSITLWEHANEATTGNYLAHNNLALALAHQKRYPEAVDHFRQALAIRPRLATAHVSLAKILEEQWGRSEEAMEEIRLALEAQPDQPDAHYSMGALLEKKGRLEEAEWHYRQALELVDSNVNAHNQLGRVLMKLGRPSEAVEHFRVASEHRPEAAGFRFNLAAALHESGDTSAAAEEFIHALRLAPNYPNEARAHAWRLATAKETHGQNPLEALRLARLANLATGCRCPEFLDTLAAAYAAKLDFMQAVACARAAEARAADKPDLAQAIRARLRLYLKKQPFRAE